MNQLIEQLSAEPALAWKVAVGLLGYTPDSPEAIKASEATRNSLLVSALL